MLYALGSNGSGQLGLSHNDDVAAPTAVTTLNDVEHGGVKQIAAGGNHTLVLMHDGSLYITGDLGIDKELPASSTFGRVPCLSVKAKPTGTIERVSATWQTCVLHQLLQQVSSVEVTGCGSRGELGLGQQTHVAVRQPLHSFPPVGTHVVDLTSCLAHTVAVLSNGEVYGWGKGRKGQLGEPTEDFWSPRKIEGVPFKAIRVVCGKDFTCVIGEPATGKLVVLGPSKGDRFGVQSNAPKSIRGWKDVAATWGSIFVLLESGTLIAWGRDDHGQLPPASLPDIQAIAAGSEHVVAQTKSGKVLAWGWGEHGNCGLPTEANGDVRRRWNELEFRGQVLRIGAGCATSWIVTSEHL